MDKVNGKITHETQIIAKKIALLLLFDTKENRNQLICIPKEDNIIAHCYFIKWYDHIPISPFLINTIICY